VPVGTAFHERTLALCESLNFKEWSGYYTVGAYEMTHEHEYNAIRNSSALIDVTPLFKYHLTGRDATKLVNRVIARDENGRPEFLIALFDDITERRSLSQELENTKKFLELVVDNIPGGAPIPQEVFERIVNSVTLKDY